MTTALYKRCACGREYTADTWRDLPRVGGEWRLPWGEVQELRNCACGSTLAVVLQEGDPE